jgi:glycosyl transferase family 25
LGRFERFASEGAADAPFLYSPFFDAAYCLSLEERPLRRAAAEAHFSELGFADRLIFNLERRGGHAPREIWASHRKMARHALDQGFQRVLMLEDDAHFLIGASELRRRLSRAFASLPASWRGLYLGHAPLQMFKVAKGLARTRSATTHAYIANRPLLEWLASAEPLDPEIPVHWIGVSIDAALANRPEMYALSPMVAIQRPFAECRVDSARDEDGRPRSPLDPMRYRTWALADGLRAAELLALAASPWRRLTLEFFRRRSGRRLAREARALRAAGAFDEQWYLSANPDVAASGRPALEHYLRDGRKENRPPRPKG